MGVNGEYLYSKEYYAKELSRTYFVEEALKSVSLPGACLLPSLAGRPEMGGVLDRDRAYVPGTGLHNGLGGDYAFEEREVSFEDERVIYAGFFSSIWGHCITDNLRRLWFLFSKEYRDKYASCRVVYIPMGDFSFSDNFSELLSMLGLESDKFVPVRRITRFREVILPEECFFADAEGKRRYFTAEYRQMIDRICVAAAKLPKPARAERLYFTYARYGRKKQVGEEKLEEFFREQGYRIIAPEKYSFREQLALLFNCRYFASTIGSCSHNVVFLQSGTRVTLIPRAYYLTEYQLALNQVHDLKVTFADASLSIFVDRKAPWTGPWYYFVSPELRQCFGIKGEPDQAFWDRQLRDFGRYRRIALRNLEGKEPVAPEFYLKKSWQYLAHVCRPGLAVRAVRALKKALRRP